MWQPGRVAWGRCEMPRLPVSGEAEWLSLGRVLFRSVTHGVAAKAQKVLQFQSLGTLAAISARWGIRGVAMPGTGVAVMGLEPDVS